jgi:hypothetical protein
MRKIRKLLALALCLCLMAGLLPAVTAERGTACTAVLTGNTGAVVTCGEVPLSAQVDDNDLAIVEIRGDQVRVIARDGAVGTARLTVQTASGYAVFDVPVGYTTFVFDGGKLTVIPGSSGAYEISGINAAGEEYLEGDANFPLPVATDGDGNQVYENTDAYKLCVNIKKTGGTFVFTGTGTDGSIAVKKAATGPAVLLLAGLDLSSSFTAPVTVKKESTSTVTVTALAGWTSSLRDSAFNNADTYGSAEDGGNGENAVYAESAVIKAKSGAQLSLNGAGVLNLNCASKNALKVGESGSLTIDELTLKVNSAKNGISSDNTMVIRGGTLEITTADGDAIRSDPDAVDPEAGCAGNIVIDGGTLLLYPKGDGIQAAQNLTVNGGSITIKTGSGYNDSSFNGDTMSWKGLKASRNTDDSTDQEDTDNTVTINGGSFELNTADDAIHADGFVVIQGGEFNIRTGDDGVHANSQADFGAVNGADCAIHLSVVNCYEGLEAKNLYIRSGCYDVSSSDDGVNAAGGSSNGSDPGPWDPWNPGPGGGDAGDYELVVSGGMVNVNAGGDGLDSNGSESLTGGSIIVWGASSSGSGSDNAPLDCDGTLLINGATVFAAGSRQMAENPGSGSQPYVKFGSSGWGGGGSSIASGKTVVVKNSSNQTVFSIKAPKAVNYALYSAPTMSSGSGWSISSDSSTPTVSRFWTEHSYGIYVQTTAPGCTTAGIETAVCSGCGGTVTREIAPTGHDWSFETVAPTETREGYDLYTCSHCGGQYRTNFTDPTGDPGPCQDGHSWDEGTITLTPTCTEAGERTFTCTVCGETMTEAVEALGHDFDDTTGVCSRCNLEAFRAVFACSEGVSVTVFPTQDLTAGGTANAAYAFPRSGDSGGIDVSGSGQVNFLVVPEAGYEVESVVVTPAANFKNLKGPEEIGTENAYRITKLTGPVTVTVTASTNVCPHEFDEDGFCIHCGLEAPKVIFACGEHCSVTAYPTQDLSANGTDNAVIALARDSVSGQVDLSGAGQVNFILHMEEGYTLESITAEPAEAFKNLKGPDEIGTENAYRITKISGTVTCTVTVKADGGGDEGWTPCDGITCPGSVFQDMPPKSHWAHDPIDWAYTQGISTGTGSDSFSPHKLCSRAEIMTFLWRAAGSPEPEAAENPFTDVKENAFYCKAVLWAVENGITAGTSASTFSPGKTCTRAEAITFLWHYLDDPEASGAENPFRDVADSEYYYPAVLWAVGAGVSSGTAPDRFSPESFCTRAQILTFLYRALV